MRPSTTLGCLVILAVAAFLTSCMSVADFPSGCGTRTVAIVVEPALLPSIRGKLSRYEADLCTGGYNTVENADGFAAPPALRGYLQGLYSAPGRNLVGAVLIGDQPHAYQWVTLHSANPSIPDTSEEAISLQYYSDLDGTFAKSPGYASPGGHAYSYDVHGGPVGWEIWVGVLPRYKGDLAETASAINRYFDKDHAFRIRRTVRPHVFLEINEHFHASTASQSDMLLNALRTGSFAWTPFSNAADARLYFDSPPAGLSVAQGYADMEHGLADFTVTDTHGNWATSGELTIEAVETDPVRTLFFWSNGCAIGDLDHADNFLTSTLYSATSDVLVAKGTTNDSGGMGTNSNGFFGHNIATALSARQSFGGAILSHVNVPLVAPWSDAREFLLGSAIVLGDPALRRSNDWWDQPAYSLRCPARPAGTVCARYDDGYIWLVADSIRAWETHGSIQVAVGLAARYEHKLGTNSVRISP